MSQPTVTTRKECLRIAKECRAYLDDSYSKIDSNTDILIKKTADDCHSVLKKELDSLHRDLASVRERARLVIGGGDPNLGPI